MLMLRARCFTAVFGFAGLLAFAAVGAAAEDDNGLDFGNEIEIEAVAGAVEIKGDDLKLKATNQSFSFDGPGYRSSLAGAKVKIDIDEAKLGIRDDDDDLEPVQFLAIDLSGFTISCGANSYTFSVGELSFTQRITSFEDRPAPWVPVPFPIGTLIGEITGDVTNQDGDTLQVLGIDILDEILSEDGLVSTTGVQLNFVTSDGVVADSVAFSGHYVGNGTNSETVIFDHGSCRTLNEQGIISAGLFIAFPFAADRLITVQSF